MITNKNVNESYWLKLKIQIYLCIIIGQYSNLKFKTVIYL